MTQQLDKRIPFRLRIENEAIEDRVIRHQEPFYKPVRVGNIWSSNYIEYGINVDRNKTLSVEEYLNKIRPYLKNIINDLKDSDAWKMKSV